MFQRRMQDFLIDKGWVVWGTAWVVSTKADFLTTSVDLVVGWAAWYTNDLDP